MPLGYAPGYSLGRFPNYAMQTPYGTLRLRA